MMAIAYFFTPSATQSSANWFTQTPVTPRCANGTDCIGRTQGGFADYIADLSVDLSERYDGPPTKGSSMYCAVNALRVLASNAVTLENLT